MFSRWIKTPKNKSFILQGPRRAGKSTYLNANYPHHKYVTLDDLDDLAWAKKDPKGFIESLGEKFIIDEAQRVPGITLPIKKLLDEKKIMAILTGPTGLLLKDQTYDTLAGRIEILKMPTCCFGENFGDPTHSILEPLQLKEAALAKREFAAFLNFGGFPEVLNFNDEKEKEYILKNYKNSYFTRDLAVLNHLENVEAIKAMYGALIKGLSSRYEMNSLAKESGLSIPTAKKYFNSLLSSGMCFKLYGHQLGPAKRYISKSKNYFLDQGILQALSSDYSLGQKLENFICSEIEKRCQIGMIDTQELFYYESVGGAEVDLIVEEKNKLYAIEIKSSKTISNKDLRNLKDFNIKSKKELVKILFYLGDEFLTQENIQIIPAWNFFRARFF